MYVFYEYKYIYVCIHICICIYMYTHTHTYIYVYIYIILFPPPLFFSRSLHAPTHVHTHTHTQTHTHTHTNTHTHTIVHTLTNTYKHIHKNMHLFTLFQLPAKKLFSKLFLLSLTLSLFLLQAVVVFNNNFDSRNLLIELCLQFLFFRGQLCPQSCGEAWAF